MPCYLTDRAWLDHDPVGKQALRIRYSDFGGRLFYFLQGSIHIASSFNTDSIY
jgi:hypothetical protein